MPRKREPAEWETNKEFCTIAAVAFWDDYSVHTGQTGAHGKTRVAASARIQLRYDGFTLAEFLEARVAELEEATAALGKHILETGMRAADLVNGTTDKDDS